MTFHSFWREELVYKAKTKEFKIKIYDMVDEFQHPLILDRPGFKMIWVEMTKNFKTISFAWVITEDNFKKDNFFNPISFGKNKWKKQYMEE